MLLIKRQFPTQNTGILALKLERILRPPEVTLLRNIEVGLTGHSNVLGERALE